jgi:hypothetical protein
MLTKAARVSSIMSCRSRQSRQATQLTGPLTQQPAKPNERFYQLLLERRLQERGVVGGHMMTANGITDVTTPHEHVEIKHWRAWKAALGQLVAYQSCAPRRRLTACFFGDASAVLKERAVETLRGHSVAVFELPSDGSAEVRLLAPGAALGDDADAGAGAGADASVLELLVDGDPMDVDPVA